MSDYQWDFPRTNFGEEKGLDSSDIETFRSNPIASLGREIVQNSIDARNGTSCSVFVEFVSDTHSSDLIPGRARIVEEIERCIAKAGGNDEERKKLENIKQALNSERMTVLRISDHGTTGLSKVFAVSDTSTSGWMGLVRSSGTSSKTEGKLGSKGIGKFAVYVVSNLRMVFYSTRNEEGEVGYEGVCRLRSAEVPGSEGDWTSGIGYYSASQKHEAIEGDIPFDWGCRRKEGDPGTDVYIIGFKEQEGWEAELIGEILKSFMAAVYHEELSFLVNGRLINKESLCSVLEDEILLEVDEREVLLGQYDALSKGDGFDISVQRFGKVARLFLTSYGPGQDYGRALNSVLVIRRPFMKIRKFNWGNAFSAFSAVLVLENGDFADRLRRIENPKHDYWEWQRIDDKKERKKLKGAFEELKGNVLAQIDAFLGKTEEDSLDFEGAGEYLADESGNSLRRVILDEESGKEILTAMRAVRLANTDTYGPSDDGEAVRPDIGTVGDGEDDDALAPEGRNKGSGSELHSSPEGGTAGTGDSAILKRDRLKTMRQRLVVRDARKGEYRVFCIPEEDVENAEMTIERYDDANKKSLLEISECRLNGVLLGADGKHVTGFSMKKGEPLVFELKVEAHEMISGVVGFYEVR